MAEGSKNNPENRNKSVNADKWVLYIDGTKKMCKVVGKNLVDKMGKVVKTDY